MITPASGQESSLLASLKQHVRTLVLATAFILSAAQAHAQGCVIARGGGGAAVMDGEGFLEAKHWQVSFAYRWFESDRHYIGTDEQPQRQVLGNQVINNSHFYDVTMTYAWSKRLNLNLTLPYATHDRSSKYEHQGNAGARYHTQAKGIGDLRLSATYWLLNPDEHHRGNFSLGLGLKAPTGDAKATDIFMRPAGPTVRFVDSSIQPGDGGWGVTLEGQGYLHLIGNLSGYLSGFYLFNPEERVEETNFSIPDAYMLRTGVDLRIPAVKGLSVSLGGRVEGVPGTDLFGYNRGSRRPGYTVAVEPGVTFSKGRFSGTLTVPVAVIRNRTTTFGSTRPGDAAFSDYTINLSSSYRF